MTNEEKYYRRTFNLLNELIYTYRNGFDRQETYDFWRKCYSSVIENPLIYIEKKEGLLLTIVIALMGVNKESIEKAEIIDGYKDSIVYFDIRDENLTKKDRDKITEFESYRSKNTIFDNWLSIIKAPEVDKSNEDIIRRIRNGLLHSNFDMDITTTGVSLTNIKTKSYYESKILNQNFHQFIVAHYANVPTVGLCERTMLFYKNIALNITSREKFKQYLENISVMEITHSVENYDGFNSLDNKIAEILKGKNKERKILEEINRAKENGINIKNINNFNLSEKVIYGCINYFEKLYGSAFYKLYDKQKEALINSYFEYIFENKRQISNCILHFYHLINHSVNPEYDIDDQFYLDDDYAILSLEPTLALLKGYLIMYRLQNTKFDNIDYSKIEFDFNKKDFWCWCTVNNEQTEENFFEEAFNKIRSKDESLSDEEINKKILCEIIRDGLAHGNFICGIDELGEDRYIEIRDINVKNNHGRCIQMSLEKFQEFLDSEAFLPKFCYKKEVNKNILKRILKRK